MKKVKLKPSRPIKSSEVKVNHVRQTDAEIVQPEPIAPEVPAYDELIAFALAYRNGAIHVPIFPSQINGVQMMGNVATFTVYQSGKFRIELSLFQPGFSIDAFRNPTTDSLVTHIAGQVNYTKNGEVVIFGAGDYSQPLENGVSRLNGQCIRVTPKDTFGFVCGILGGAILSFNMRVDGQDWPIAKPS